MNDPRIPDRDIDPPEHIEYEEPDPDEWYDMKRDDEMYEAREIAEETRKVLLDIGSFDMNKRK